MTARWCHLWLIWRIMRNAYRSQMGFSFWRQKKNHLSQTTTRSVDCNVFNLSLSICVISFYLFVCCLSNRYYVRSECTYFFYLSLSICVISFSPYVRSLSNRYYVRSESLFFYLSLSMCVIIALHPLCLFIPYPIISS